MTPNFNQKTIASKAVRSLLWLLIGLPVLAIVSIVLVTGVSDERVLMKTTILSNWNYSLLLQGFTPLT